MACAIDYTDVAPRQLRKLDKTSARRILDYMDQRVAPLEDARSLGKALHGPLGDLWRYRVGHYRIICELRHKEVRIVVIRLGMGVTFIAENWRQSPAQARPHPEPAANGWRRESSRVPDLKSCL